MAQAFPDAIDGTNERGALRFILRSTREAVLDRLEELRASLEEPPDGQEFEDDDGRVWPWRVYLHVEYFRDEWDKYRRILSRARRRGLTNNIRRWR